ncbi:MAG: hypothetical protein J6A79_00220 [Clostridia bacterium]|nr:hypothetical protein [Clostridia bacterium]
MSYTKQTWQTGDTITAEKLNHIEDGVDDLSRQLSDNDLHLEEIPDTTQAITFDQSGNVQSIVRSRNNTAVRTDVFTFGENTITEVRTLANGHSLTMVTNLTTLETTVTYSEGGNG